MLTDHINNQGSLKEIHREPLTVVKVGGAVVEDERRLKLLLDSFASIPGRKILVHGGGRKATKIAAALGIESKMMNGRRITDDAMLEIVTMVYGGLINKNVVAYLQESGINALGLTGADMNVIRSHKRPVKDGIDFGLVGDIDEVNGEYLSRLVEMGVTPVMAPLTHDGRGQLLNTNADTIASETAKALAAHFDVTLVFTFEKNGVLRNPEDAESVIPVIMRADFDKYIADGTITDGMIPKIENALSAIDAGVSRVIITKAEAMNGLHGTIIEK